jgi:hypothetical protein
MQSSAQPGAKYFKGGAQMMDCQMFVSMMDDFVDSTLSPADRHRMEEHLRMCGNCRKELEDLKSLLAHSADLSEKPQRDLWPQIEAGINAAGVPQTASADQPASSAFSMRAFGLTWRLAAVAILGTVILLATNYFRNSSSTPVSRTTKGLTDVTEANGNPKPSGSQDKQGLRRDLDSRQSESNESQPSGPAGNYAEACQCSPSPEISALIDRGSIIDEILPGMRAREAVSEQLYTLAGENSDDFFLHKASLENYSFFPLPAASSTATRRYLSKLVQRPDDPVWAYLYASSLFGKNTPEMIRLMRQLVADHAEFPWPYLSLAKVYGLFDYTDESEARSYLQAFMKLCPESPEPLPILVAFSNSDFLTDTVRRMRLNLAARSDIHSLLLYLPLWSLEARRGAAGEEFSKIQQRIRGDLKRLEGTESGRREQLAEVIRSGYRQIGDVDTFKELFEKDTSWSGRWGAVMLKMQEWNKENPAPPADSPAEKKTAYWENRLRMSESLIDKMPENPSLWIIKLESLAALKGHPQSEFLEAASNVLALEREGAETPELGTHLGWKSNLLKLASLCANQGLFLDQIPALIREGYAAAERRNYENSTDLWGNSQWASLMSRFNVWLEANDAWHSLADACLRVGKLDEASGALDSIENGLREFKTLLAQANARRDDGVTIEVQRKSMADKLAKLEERYAAARASERRAARK